MNEVILQSKIHTTMWSRLINLLDSFLTIQVHGIFIYPIKISIRVAHELEYSSNCWTQVVFRMYIGSLVLFKGISYVHSCNWHCFTFFTVINLAFVNSGLCSLQHTEIPIPSPKKDEVLLKLEATSVNPIDWKVQKGMLRPFLPPRFPFVPGKILMHLYYKLIHS